jgi:hypothetical protein
VRPLLLVCVDILKGRPKELDNFLNRFCGWGVRGTIVGSWLRITMENVVGEICEHLRTEAPSLLSTADIFGMLNSKGMIPNDETFREAVKSRPIKRDRAMAFLISVENYKRWEQLDPSPATDTGGLNFSWLEGISPGAGDPAEKLTIEHILPQTPDNRRPRYKEPRTNERESEFAEKVESPGNLTLLAGPRNSRARNGGFQEKKVIYGSSKLEITKKIADYGEWGRTKFKQGLRRSSP